jgi:putative addiction module component (TIGR02574 family)
MHRLHFLVRDCHNIGMDTHAEQILQSALSLPYDERVEIAESLIWSLDEKEAMELEAAWAQEIKRRLDSIDRGEAKMIPWEDAIRSMRERLNG